MTTPAAPAPADRPMRLVGLFSARKVSREEIPRLVEWCSKAFAEEAPGAYLKLLEPRPEDGPFFRLEVLPGAMLKESEVLLRVHDIDDPASDHEAILQHMEKLDAEIGRICRDAVHGAQSYLALVGTRLAEGGRIRAFLNVGALVGSALGAMFVDPAAVMVTPDAGEWAEACEQSLSIEGAMASLREK
jgi:hypothetical protein